MTNLNASDPVVIEYRKANYWRGFRAACLLLAPFIIFLMVAIEIILKNI